jgi:hypothetical protein
LDPYRKIIDFINNIRKTSLNPNLEMKGKVFIEPDLVIVTTNRALNDDYIKTAEEDTNRPWHSEPLDVGGKCNPLRPRPICIISDSDRWVCHPHAISRRFKMCITVTRDDKGWLFTPGEQFFNKPGPQAFNFDVFLRIFLYDIRQHRLEQIQYTTQINETFTTDIELDSISLFCKTFVRCVEYYWNPTRYIKIPQFSQFYRKREPKLIAQGKRNKFQFTFKPQSGEEDMKFSDLLKERIECIDPNYKPDIFRYEELYLAKKKRTLDSNEDAEFEYLDNYYDLLLDEIRIDTSHWRPEQDPRGVVIRRAAFLKRNAPPLHGKSAVFKAMCYRLPKQGEFGYDRRTFEMLLTKSFLPGSFAMYPGGIVADYTKDNWIFYAPSPRIDHDMVRIPYLPLEEWFDVAEYWDSKTVKEKSGLPFRTQKKVSEAQASVEEKIAEGKLVAHSLVTNKPNYLIPLLNYIHSIFHNFIVSCCIMLYVIIPRSESFINYNFEQRPSLSIFNVKLNFDKMFHEPIDDQSAPSSLKDDSVISRITTDSLEYSTSSHSSSTCTPERWDTNTKWNRSDFYDLKLSGIKLSKLSNFPKGFDGLDFSYFPIGKCPSTSENIAQREAHYFITQLHPTFQLVGREIVIGNVSIDLVYRDNENNMFVFAEAKKHPGGLQKQVLRRLKKIERDNFPITFKGGFSYSAKPRVLTRFLLP